MTLRPLTRPRPTSLLASVLVVLALAVVVGLYATRATDDGADTSGGQGSGLLVEDATIDWPANPEVAAVRMRIRNLDATDDALVGVSSIVARSAMVHRTEIDAEGRAVMQMSEQVPIAARSTVTFEPSGLHVMLSGITEDLQVGDEVPIDLIFREAGTVSITAVVVEPAGLGEGVS